MNKFYFNDFGDFLRLVNNASVSLAIKQDETGKDYEEIQFNFIESPQKYSAELENIHTEVRETLIDQIKDIYSKYDKLIFISKKLEEIKNCKKFIIKDQNNLYTHKLFKFFNASEKTQYKKIIKGENSFQDYYFWMDHYLDKMQSLLDSILNTIKITKQEDFPLPQSMIPNPNSSSIEKPFEFFEYIYSREGLKILRQDFIPKEEDYFHYPQINYDPKTETIEIEEVDNESGDLYSRKILFKDLLFSKVYNEHILSKKYLDDHINLLESDEKVIHFISLNLSKLNYLLKQVNNSKPLKKYDVAPKPIAGLIKYLYEKYPSFCPPLDDESSSIIKAQTKISEIPEIKKLPPIPVKSFSWKTGEPMKCTFILHDLLIKANIIDKLTPLTTFSKAFDGSPIEHPLKIKWMIIGRNKKVGKHSLYYFFNQLADSHLLLEDGNNPTLRYRLKMIFVDSKGNPLENLSESNSASIKSKSKPEKKNVIDQVIETLTKQVK